MEDFPDRWGRLIQIDVDDCSAQAHFAGKVIGEIRTTGLDYLDHGQVRDAVITWMGVEVDFREAGIGLEMIRCLAAQLGPLKPASRDRGIGDENALTNEGRRLTVRAQAEGYVQPFREEEEPW